MLIRDRVHFFADLLRPDMQFDRNEISDSAVIFFPDARALFFGGFLLRGRLKRNKGGDIDRFVRRSFIIVAGRGQGILSRHDSPVMRI